MLAACEASLPADVAIFAAAVADWGVENAAAHKLKKRAGPPAPVFVANPDILAALSAPGPRRPLLTVGFAAETDDIAANAEQKRASKHCDWVVANDVRPETGIMGGTDNEVSIFDAAGARGLAAHEQDGGGGAACRRGWPPRWTRAEAMPMDILRPRQINDTVRFRVLRLALLLLLRD